MSLDIWLTDENGREVFEANITHNLTTMADKAGVYTALWRPEDLKDVRVAKDLIPYLVKGLQELADNYDTYQQYNPVNGWGNYANLISLIARYHIACIRFPDATIHICK